MRKMIAAVVFWLLVFAVAAAAGWLAVSLAV